MLVQLDTIDRKILRAIQYDCMLGADALSEQCGASSSTILRRIKRMRTSGVITGEVAIVDPKKVGRPILLILGIRLENEKVDTAAKFIKAMRQHQAVTQCFFVTGSMDYILHLSVRDMSEYENFIRDSVTPNHHVKLTETNVVVNAIKTGMTVPIDEPE